MRWGVAKLQNGLFGSCKMILVVFHSFQHQLQPWLIFLVRIQWQRHSSHLCTQRHQTQPSLCVRPLSANSVLLTHTHHRDPHASAPLHPTGWHVLGRWVLWLVSMWTANGHWPALLCLLSVPVSVLLERILPRTSTQSLVRETSKYKCFLLSYKQHGNMTALVVTVT